MSGEENPLLEGLQLRRTPEPCALVIYGASGDLTQRKLLPALYSLTLRRLLPDTFAVVGVSRSAVSDEEFRARMREGVVEHARDARVGADDGSHVEVDRALRRGDGTRCAALASIRITCALVGHP